MILLLSLQHDVHLSPVLACLEKKGALAQVLSWRNFPQGGEIGLQFPSGKSNLLFGREETITKQLKLEEVTAVWNRRAQRPQAASHLNASLQRYIEAEKQELLDSFPDHCGQAAWLDLPHITARAHLKAVQLKHAETLGITIPASFIGNCPEQAAQFLSQQQQVILKSIAWGHYTLPPSRWERLKTFCTKRLKTLGIVSTTKPAMERVIEIPSRRFQAEELLPQLNSISLCPVIIQAYVPKAYELRITVVGQKVFACRIDSPQAHTPEAQVDWRLDIENIPHSAHTLPDAIAQQCLDLCRALGLQYGAIDMIVTPEGEHVFLEINPQGQWLWVQQRTGLPIAEAIADWLMHPPAGN